ncbi:MAG: hypothetical protein PHF14_10680 [Verrucomicrobiota bacterium]|jgi:hypothetical protein|nr:hypothetical protein [Verrucomicrobiota bacterium]
MKSKLQMFLLLVTIGALAWGLAVSIKLRRLQEEKLQSEALHHEQYHRQHQLEHQQAMLEAVKDQLEAVSTNTPPTEVEAPNAESEPSTPQTEEAPLSDQATQQRVMRAQLGILLDMSYGELFTVLNLPTETQPAVRELLLDYSMAERQAIIEAISAGNVPAKDVLEKKAQAKRDLRTHLEELLSPEELTTWEEYEKFKDQNLYESLLEGQLAMLAPNLGEANRKLAKQVLAEELDQSIRQFESSEEVYTMDHFNQAQSRALQKGLDRMVESLPETEFLELERFTKIVEEVFKAASQP